MDNVARILAAVVRVEFATVRTPSAPPACAPHRARPPGAASPGSRRDRRVTVTVAVAVDKLHVQYPPVGLYITVDVKCI